MTLMALAGCDGSSDFTIRCSIMAEVRARPTGNIEPMPEVPAIPKPLPTRQRVCAARSSRQIKVDLVNRQKRARVWFSPIRIGSSSSWKGSISMQFRDGRHD
jgi:type IV pilus assembly protein PilP